MILTVRTRIRTPSTFGCDEPAAMVKHTVRYPDEMLENAVMAATNREQRRSPRVSEAHPNAAICHESQDPIHAHSKKLECGHAFHTICVESMMTMLDDHDDDHA